MTNMIFLISLYQNIRKFLGLSSACRFTPTCSEYAKQAIARHGIIAGSVLGLKRIFRCHPWNKGGYDPVPSKKFLIFPPAWTSSMRSRAGNF